MSCWCALLINSPTWEALSPDQCTLMMMLLPGLRNPVWLLADFALMTGSGMGSHYAESLQGYDTASPLICMRDLDSVQCHAKRQNHFYLSCLRKLLTIRWQVNITDTEVLKTIRMQSVQTLLKLVQLT